MQQQVCAKATENLLPLYNMENMEHCRNCSTKCDMLQFSDLKCCNFRDLNCTTDSFEAVRAPKHDKAKLWYS